MFGNLFNRKTNQNGKNSSDSRTESGTKLPSVSGLVITLVVLCGVIAATYVLGRRWANAPAEIQIGIAIALIIVVMMTVLFVISAGFARLGLGSKSHALGLPDGSIRALIALFLIQIFVIFGIYLHSQTDDYYGPMRMERGSLSSVEGVIMTRIVSEDTRMIDVWIDKENENQARLAQQLLTMVGTLVVAVSGFYFGSNSVTNATDSAVKAVTVASASAAMNTVLTISGFTPDKTQKGAITQLAVKGSGFRWPLQISLIREHQSIPAANIRVLDPTSLTCEFKIPADATVGDWKIVVVASDGSGVTESANPIKIES